MIKIMKYDFIIIGSGIIGLTLAYKLKKTNNILYLKIAEICLFERQQDFVKERRVFSVFGQLGEFGARVSVTQIQNKHWGPDTLA